MIRTAFAFVALSLGTAAVSQTPAPAPAQPATPAQSSAQFWAVSDTQVASVPARIAFPRLAGSVSAVQTTELSHQGQGLDLAIQYRSPDQTVFATVYIYYPSLAHAGLTAFATDNAIRHNSTTPVTASESRAVAAGGVDGVAIRRDYTGYRGNLASSAAFIKTDRWMVKLRVSGPEARRQEVMQAMDELLAGIQFGRQFRPRPAALVQVADCPAGAGASAARELDEPTGAESAAHAFLATLDGGGNAATEEGGGRRDLPSRVQSSMCLSQRARIGELVVPILRGSEGPPLSVDGRTMLIAVINDAGETIEVVHAPNLRRYWLLRHRVGETLFLRSYEGTPSDAQVAAAIEESLSNRRPVNIRVRLSPDGRDQIFVPGGTIETSPDAPTT